MTAARGALADARTEARLHFRAGMDLIAQKQFDEGIRQLQKANEILPHPNVTFNIARAHAEAGHIEQALAAYREYIASDPPDREQVTRIVEQLEQRLAAQRTAAIPEPKQPPTPAPQQPAPQQPAPGEAPAPPTPAGEPAAQGAPATAATKPAAPAPGPGSKAAPGDAAGIVGAARTEDVYQETVVTASRGAQSPLDSPNSTTIVTRQDIRLSGITRIPELLRRVAGMDVMQITGGDENVSMRGFNSRLANKILVLVNGRTVKNDVLGSTFWEALSIDVDQIERIEVVRGPGSALYGADAFAGIVNIITIEPGVGKSGFRAGYGDHRQGYASVLGLGARGRFRVPPLRGLHPLPPVVARGRGRPHRPRGRAARARISARRTSASTSGPRSGSGRSASSRWAPATPGASSTSTASAPSTTTTWRSPTPTSRSRTAARTSTRGRTTRASTGHSLLNAAYLGRSPVREAAAAARPRTPSSKFVKRSARPARRARLPHRPQLPAQDGRRGATSRTTCRSSTRARCSSRTR